MPDIKYIFVTGGVTSSLGKGIIAASLAKLLQAQSFKVTIQKFDPYINVDPGTLNPYEHGECYVTDDGAETDLDLGHYERFLKIAHEKTGLLRGTDWAYKQQWTERTKRDFFRDTYCKRFPPYSVLVFNFPVSPDAGHTPQNLLAEYIDASRRSKLKRRSRAISETNADEDEDSGSFWGDDEDEDEDMDPANRQEGGAEHSNDALGDVMMFGSGDESMQMDVNELEGIVSDFDVDEDLDERERQPKRQRREDGMSLQEMMEHVGQMDAEAEANYIPPAVQSGGDGNLAHQPTYFGDSGLGPNPFIDMEADEN